jgi:hypothetical protein
MKGFRRWIAAYLWRRLAFYHLVAIFGTLVMVQLVVALLTMATSRAAPIPGTGTAGDLAPWVRFAGYLFGAALGTAPALVRTCGCHLGGHRLAVVGQTTVPAGADGAQDGRR